MTSQSSTVTKPQYVSQDGARLAKVLARGHGYRVVMFNTYFESTSESYYDNLAQAEDCAQRFITGQLDCAPDLFD